MKSLVNVAYCLMCNAERGHYKTEAKYMANNFDDVLYELNQFASEYIL